MMHGIKTLIGVALLTAGLALPPESALADTTAEAEIEALLAAVGESGCAFVRNGKRHSAEDAESHLRRKYRRGRRHAKTAELFIERLATASSMTKRPYEIDCDGRVERTGDWLMSRLVELRSAAPSEAS